ncbi:hypothetical protein LOY67_18205 [Pseudomonas sp. B21-056]|jgi:hypothetical protein|uniref:hypothetical protein n=1 Tax=Pseudomonas sp. B21-056 TaxID=2895495 RepID=UPI002230ED87|nr:hypothetical protein [Pseudomonas sp. B21-056]UZE21979.1 hypothetical protein LOY67_18205 [Pseudomonas sp. B21-056]
MAVIAAAGKMGVGSDELCAQAVGGLMSGRYWNWANAQYAQGAADEIDNALNILVGRPMARVKLPEAEIGIGVTLQSPSQASN